MKDETFYSHFVASMFKEDCTDDRHYLLNFGRLHAAVGLADEAAEVLGVLKKHIFTDKPYDRDALVKELGDVEFYLQALRNTTGITRDEVLNANVEKLEARHKGRNVTEFYRGY